MVMLFLLSAAVLELITHVVGRWPRLRSVAAVCTLAISAVATSSLLLHPNIFGALLFILSLYRMGNILRVIRRRMYETYLRSATRSTSLSLIGLQLLTALVWLAWDRWHTTGYITWGVVGVTQAVVAALFLLSVLRTLKRTAWPAAHTNYSDKELPSVTVAIPARNETEDLQQCLQSVIASDYPKLEIIVLDDCSQTKRTPEIIREFAHDGVRFIQGAEPLAVWLPKNQAYKRLADEASGAYVIFCGVDVRFAPDSIRSLIATMLDRKKQMMCILPLRQQRAYGRLSLVQAMRYWWELVPPRRAFRRPPVLSSCWAISMQALKKAGGFAAVSRAIVPEAHFARELAKADEYSFLRSVGLGIESNKTVGEQRATAVRMRYPQMHRRPEQVALASLWEVVFLLLPFVLAVGGFWFSIGVVAHVGAVVACVLLTIAYEAVVLSTRVNSWWFGLIAQPFAALSDIGILHYSMWKYEFSEVDWKGRNVCIPVMHVVPNLPASGLGK
jgi:hypothetical protein